MGMTTRPTPETDVLVAAHGLGGGLGAITEKSRQLERERDEALELLREYLRDRDTHANAHAGDFLPRLRDFLARLEKGKQTT